LLKSWIYTNLIGSITAIIILMIASYPTESTSLTIDIFISIFLMFFIYGIIMTLPHLIYSNYIRKKYEQREYWKKTKISMSIPYLIILFLIIVFNPDSIVIFSTFGIFLIHYIIGYIVWRHLILKVKSQA
jgi:hypothetical protein